TNADLSPSDLGNRLHEPIAASASQRASVPTRCRRFDLTCFDVLVAHRRGRLRPLALGPLCHLRIASPAHASKNLAGLGARLRDRYTIGGREGEAPDTARNTRLNDERFEPARGRPQCKALNPVVSNETRPSAFDDRFGNRGPHALSSNQQS